MVQQKKEEVEKRDNQSGEDTNNCNCSLLIFLSTRPLMPFCPITHSLTRSLTHHLSITRTLSPHIHLSTAKTAIASRVLSAYTSTCSVHRHSPTRWLFTYSFTYFLAHRPSITRTLSPHIILPTTKVLHFSLVFLFITYLVHDHSLPI